MKNVFHKSVYLWAVACIVAGCSHNEVSNEPAIDSKYEDLVTFFEEWRLFQEPVRVDGIPNYSAEAMAEQSRTLSEYQARLSAINPRDWPVSQQIDYLLVRAEMNGLEFEHRARRPWARDPAFYVMIYPSPTDIPAREGPIVAGAIELWTYALPLTEDKNDELAGRIGAIPPLLEQAKKNLVGSGRDLWMMGIRRMKRQSRDLSMFLERLDDSFQSLSTEVRRAVSATDEFVEWLEEKAPEKTGPSGVGADQYSWYMRYVHLVPYSWEEQVTIVRRELNRAHAALRLEEHRNRDLPTSDGIETAAEYDRRLNDAVTEYMAFLEDEEIVSIRPYLDGALRERIGRFSPSDGPREFFSEVTYSDPLVMRTHGYHWFDLARMENDPHPSPIRRVPLLYNIFDSRAEGVATGMEEMMMHAGLFDDRPRARELVWILLAQRAARALGDLYMHSNDWTIEEAVAFASKWTPRGWLPEESNTVWGEQHLYLQQPGYGTSYVIGKVQIENVIAEYARLDEANFTLKKCLDDIDAAGLIPVSLIRWELTGFENEIVDMNMDFSDQTK